MILTVTDLAERWSCSRFHVYDLCKHNRIPYFTIGVTSRKGIRFKLSEIERFENGNVEPPVVEERATQASSLTNWFIPILPT